MEADQKKGETQANQGQVVPYGVFQITQDGKVVDYGLGVAHASDKFVTLKKYFKEGRELGRIFFKKLDQGQQFPLSYDLDEAKLSGFIINTGQLKRDELESQIFVKISLDIDIEEVPTFLSAKSIDSIDSGKKGYSIGLDKLARVPSLHKMIFELDSHIMDLRLKYETALLFVFKGNKDYCYGFYEEEGDKNLGYDLFLSDEFLAGNASQNEAFIENNKIDKVYDPYGKVPFQSIGILTAPNRTYGTAQLLRNSKGCKYLITCAHNFVGNDYDLVDRRSQYTFQLPKYNSHKPLRYVMQRVPKFKIKQVYIPEEYKSFFSQVQQEQNIKQAVFPAIEPDIPQVIENISIKTFYDIAIIELQDNLDVAHGFAIEKKIPITGPVQVAGFPTSGFKGNIFGIVQDNMYMESTASHPGDKSYVRLSEESDGDIIMMHKLSTLPGNSGSAIYERISDSQVRLLAIHTTGTGIQGQIYGLFNFGTYIHGKNIKNWINSVLNQ